MTIKFKVLWSESAYRDLAGIIHYIAENSPSNARKVLARIKQKVSALYLSPERGRIVPELQEQNIVMCRELIIAPWRVIYRISGKEVLVFSMIDSRRNIEDILLRKLTDMIF